MRNKNSHLCKDNITLYIYFSQVNVLSDAFFRWDARCGWLVKQSWYRRDQFIVCRTSTDQLRKSGLVPLLQERFIISISSHCQQSSQWLLKSLRVSIFTVKIISKFTFFYRFESIGLNFQIYLLFYLAFYRFIVSSFYSFNRFLVKKHRVYSIVLSL